jgi:uncharacterized protein YdeI (YjbR/CyaY-like superfamily)
VTDQRERFEPASRADWRSCSWSLLDSVEALEAPADLLAALAASPAAVAAWQRFTPRT